MCRKIVAASRVAFVLRRSGLCMGNRLMRKSGAVKMCCPCLLCLQLDERDGIEQTCWTPTESRMRAWSAGAGTGEKCRLDGNRDLDCLSDADSDESEDSNSGGYVRDRILQNMLQKSQAIESENRTLREKLALYAFEFERLKGKIRSDALRAGRKRGWVSDLKPVAESGHSTGLEDVLTQLKDVMKEWRIEERRRTNPDLEGDMACGRPCPEAGGCGMVECLSCSTNGKDRRGLLREIQRLRSELCEAREQIKELSAAAETEWCQCRRGRAAFNGALLDAQTRFGPIRSVLGISHGESTREIVAKIAALKAENISNQGRLEAGEGKLSQCSAQLESSKIQIGALKHELAEVRACNERLTKERGGMSSQIAKLKETVLRWRQTIHYIGAQVHELRPVVDRMNSFEGGNRLEKLQMDLSNARELLQGTAVTSLRRAADLRGKFGASRSRKT